MNLFSKNSGRFYKKHNNQHCKYNGIGKLGGYVGTSQNLNNSKENSADQCSRIDPIPPKTAAVNALIPGMEPVYGVRDG